MGAWRASGELALEQTCTTSCGVAERLACIERGPGEPPLLAGARDRKAQGLAQVAAEAVGVF